MLFCFCFSQKIIHDFGDKKIVDFDFYFETQKNSWDNLSDENKKKGFDGFLKKELVLYDFEKNGLDLKPSVFIKLKERDTELRNQLISKILSKKIDEKKKKWNHKEEKSADYHHCLEKL